MKVCFIWVEKFRNFKNFSLNLSSSAKFEFDFERNILTRKNCQTLPDNFFGQQIEDVTGLIGKNGAGKSNALALVCNSLKNSKSGLSSNFLLVTGEDGIQTCHYSFKRNLSPPRANFNIEIVEYIGDVKELKVIYFSNVFSKRSNNFGKEVSDISVRNSTLIDWRRSKKSDFEKQLQLINSNVFKEIQISTPSGVLFAPKTFNRLNAYAYSREYESVPNFKDLKDLFRIRLRDITGKNKFLHLVRLSYFEYALGLRIDSGINIKLQENANELISGFSEKIGTEEISDRLIRFLSNSFKEEISLSYKNDFYVNGGIDSSRLIEQTDFLLEIQSKFSNIDISHSSEGFRGRSEDFFEIAFESKSKFLIEEFVSLFRELIAMNVDWNGISSGHMAYLNLFSSIYDELKNSRNKSLILCIDEGDLYLHPIWQIEFFSKLLSVLPEMFRGKIQILLTSHSPFLLSDLPNQCITILDQDADGGTMNGIDLDGLTFGANLYDLYAKPFFLGNQTMSQFAFEKIANYLDNIDKQSGPPQKAADDISHLIGDEVIRFKLKRIFDHD